MRDDDVNPPIGMKVLAVEDDPVALAVLARTLRKLGHEVVTAANGEEALARLAAEPVRVVVSDWVMPGVDGLELCRRVRGRLDADYVYFILLTGLVPSEDNQREAIEAGVDDFLNKPLQTQEIWMRLRVAERILRFATQVRQLEEFLPICGYCKKVRDDSNYWQQIESYINTRTGTDFSHSVCPDCYKQVVAPQLESLRREVAGENAAEATDTDATANKPGAVRPLPPPHVRRTH
ncbi:MAG: response regulator [Verrucomicrobia bacterium]|nr:response regulator [Verrucomicrobiota bacterium]